MLTARDDDQSFTSEHYPSDYSNNQTCQWSISAAAGYSVNLIITNYTLAEGDTVTVSVRNLCLLTVINVLSERTPVTPQCLM